MTNKDFYSLMDITFKQCLELAHKKGADYTKGSPDALANFKEGGKEMGIDPKKVAYIFMKKHWAAIVNYIRTGGQSESEPIFGSIDDLINYLVLVKGLIKEEQDMRDSASVGPSPSNEKLVAGGPKVQEQDENYYHIIFDVERSPRLCDSFQIPTRQWDEFVGVAGRTMKEAPAKNKYEVGLKNSRGIFATTTFAKIKDSVCFDIKN
jgi:hypothetical protein